MSGKPTSRLLYRLETVSDWVESLEKHCITILTLGFGLLLMYNLTLRAFNLQGLTWIEEFARYMLVATTLIGCSVAVRHRGHMVMDTVVTMLPVRGGQILLAIGYLICSVLYLYLFYYAYRWTGRLVKMNRFVESVNFPLWPVWMFFTYAIFTMGLRYLVQALKSVGGAVRGAAVLSEQDAEIAKALAEEEERRRAVTGGGGKGGGP